MCKVHKTENVNEIASPSPNENKEKMATYADVVSDELMSQNISQSDNSNGNIRDNQRNPSDFVKPIFLKDEDVHGSMKPPRSQWLTNVEIYNAIGARVPAECIKGIQRIREMWRIYMDNEGDRLSLLVQGVNLRGRRIPLLSQNPHNPSRLQPNTIRIKVKNIPLSADDGQIHRALTLQGCEIQGLFRERLRVNGKLTNCETGDRLVISKTLDNPIPRNLQIGKYMGKIFHAGQPEFQNRNHDPQANNRTCHKCLKPGHFMYECPNDWVCKRCKQSGHKAIDCPQGFQNETDETDDASNEQRHVDIQPSTESPDSASKSDAGVATLKTPQSTDNKTQPNKPGNVAKNVKHTSSDKADKSQVSLDKYVKTPLSQRRVASARTPPTPPEELHDKATGGNATKKAKAI